MGRVQAYLNDGPVGAGAATYYQKSIVRLK